MNKTNNPVLTDTSQKLRTEMTPEEKHLWYDFLKNLPVTVNRQKVMGNYIADFYCASAKIIIELDGSQHYSAENKLHDKERDDFFKSLGINVLRYSNLELNNNFESVCADIMKHIPPHPSRKA